MTVNCEDDCVGEAEGCVDDVTDESGEMTGDTRMIPTKMVKEVGTEVALGEEEHHNYGPEAQRVNYMLSYAWMRMRMMMRNRGKKRRVCSWNQRMDHPTHDP